MLSGYSKSYREVYLPSCIVTGKIHWYRSLEWCRDLRGSLGQEIARVVGQTHPLRPLVARCGDMLGSIRTDAQNV